MIYYAIAIMNSKFSGCVKIRPKKSSDSHYVTITGKKDKGCRASVGKRGGQQYLNLAQNDCMKSSTIQHEFMHALGMYHVQSRPDRDQYVKINWNNIKSDKKHNFYRLTNTLT